MKAWYAGSIGDAAQCRISVLDHGLLYGDGIFEGIRITAGRVFRLDCHLARLGRSARAIGLTLPHSTSEIRNIVLATARAYDEADAYVRLIVTRGAGELGVDPASCHQPQLICIVAELKMFSTQVQQSGLRMMTSALRRPRSDSLDAQVKSLNYLNNVLAKRDARVKGFDDALLLNMNGEVAEASGANVFAVIDGLLSTPPCSAGALAGLTRDTVMNCHATNGSRVSERTLTRYDMLNASEVFICGSGAGLLAVASLDDVTLGNDERPVLETLRAAYADYAVTHGTAF
jgi:branched-chain amino acid aminotransferase